MDLAAQTLPHTPNELPTWLGFRVADRAARPSRLSLYSSSRLPEEEKAEANQRRGGSGGKTATGVAGGHGEEFLRRSRIVNSALHSPPGGPRAVILKRQTQTTSANERRVLAGAVYFPEESRLGCVFSRAEEKVKVPTLGPQE